MTIYEIEDSDNSENENYHNTYRERKRMLIISDFENENKTKDVENEENIVKAEFCRWPFVDVFIIIFRFGSHQCLNYYTKGP